MDKKPVLRYAPSPTGPQHIGGIRTALYCYLFAQKTGGEFILRIEDTDRTRYVEGAEEFIVEACNWLGISFTQGVHVGGPNGPYRQSERLELYRRFANQLVAEGKAYLAFDTPQEIDEMKQRMKDAGAHLYQYNYVSRSSMNNSLTLAKEEVQKRIDNGDPYVIRFLINPKEDIRFKDEVRDWVVIHSSQLDDKVLIKSDGFPTYHLANIVDDHHMGVTHVIRGEEWLSSTPLHILLYRAFEWEAPTFAHLPLLINPDNSKMSKRNADKFGIPVYPMDWLDKDSGETWHGFKEKGYLPPAFLNYLALLGWHPSHEQEILSMEELIENFSLDRVHKSAVKFDMDKLKFFNAHYLRANSDEALIGITKEELAQAGLPVPADEFLQGVVTMMRERVSFPGELVSNCPYFYAPPADYDAKQVKKRWKGNAPSLLQEFAGRLEALETWDEASIEAAFKGFIEEKEVGFGKLMMPLRLALSGVGGGPSGYGIAELLGKEESLSRIQTALDTLGIPEQG